MKTWMMLPSFSIICFWAGWYVSSVLLVTPRRHKHAWGAWSKPYSKGYVVSYQTRFCKDPGCYMAEERTTR